MINPVLQARNLVRDLGRDVKTRAVDDVSLDVMENELVALTGPSGSGKSTLLYLLGVLDRPTSGEVLIGGVDVTRLDEADRARFRRESLGFVFQFHYLLGDFTVLDNITMPLLHSRRFPYGEVKHRADLVLEKLGIAELRDRRPHQLSGGQQQRVSFARAVIGAPKLLLADEPTGNLDSRNAELVMALISDFVRTEGLTVVMVTHNSEQACRAGREVRLRDGRLVDDVRHRAP